MSLAAPAEEQRIIELLADALLKRLVDELDRRNLKTPVEVKQSWVPAVKPWETPLAPSPCQCHDKFGNPTTTVINPTGASQS